MTETRDECSSMDWGRLTSAILQKKTVGIVYSALVAGW